MTSAALAPPAAPAAARVRGALPWVLLAVTLLALPYVFPSRTALTLLCVIGANAVFALSYNMLLGQGGMLSFGHAVYYGLGAYAGAHALGAIKAFALPVPVFFLPAIGFAAGLLAGAVIGWPCCRRSGTPFAMISLGVGELVAAAGFMFKGLFGGEDGISGDRSVGPAFLGMKLGAIGNVYWFVAFWLFIAALGMWAFTRTPLGRLANAVRDNAERVSFIGFDPRRVRYLVFIAAGGFAGLAGALSTVTFEIATPDMLGALPSAAALVMAYIGGIGLFWGPLLGAVVLTVARSMLSDYTRAWELYVGLLFMAVVMFAPGGLAGVLVSAERALGAARPASLKKALRYLGVAPATAGVVILVEAASRWREGARPLAFAGWTLDPGAATPWVLGATLLLSGWLLLRWNREKEPG